MYKGEKTVEVGQQLVGTQITYNHIGGFVQDSNDIFTPSKTSSTPTIQITDLSKEDREFLGSRFEQNKTISCFGTFDFQVKEDDTFILNGVNYRVVAFHNKINYTKIFANSYNG